MYRVNRMQPIPTGVSRFAMMLVHQGRVERFLLDSLKEHSDIAVERRVLPVSLDIEENQVNDTSAYPVTVKLQHLPNNEAIESSGTDGHHRLEEVYKNLPADEQLDLKRRLSGKEGTEETVRAKYVIGCDGAHSWTRDQLGIKMEGDSTDSVWGVLDVVPITDFREARLGALMESRLLTACS
jgi:phenol 2-monooxygenase (NADPH)